MLKSQFMALLRRLPDHYELLLPSIKTGMWHEPLISVNDTTAFIELSPGYPYGTRGDPQPSGAIPTLPKISPEAAAKQEEEQQVPIAAGHRLCLVS